MKNLIVITIFSIINICLYGQYQTNIILKSDDYNLTGEIKKITQEIYSINGKKIKLLKYKDLKVNEDFKAFENIEQTSFEIIEIFFNKDGYISKEIISEKESKLQKLYTSNNKKDTINISTSNIHSDKEKNCCITDQYFYENNLLVKRIIDNPIKKIKVTSLYIYDEIKNIIKESHIIKIEENELTMVFRYEYDLENAGETIINQYNFEKKLEKKTYLDEYNKKIKTVEFSTNPNLVNYEFFNYNDNNDITYYKKEFILNKKKYLKYEYFLDYKYDQFGNWIECLIFKNIKKKKENIYTLKRNIEYY